jgi:hypothetical protein
LKRKLLLACLLCTLLSPAFTNAQNANSLQYPTLLKELNRDIWIPYSEAVRANDATKLLSLLSQDFIRVYPFNKRIVNLTQFSEGIRQSYQKDKTNEEQKKDQAANIIFRFSERIITEDFASERGVYQEMNTTSHGETQSSYEKFHVLSRKEKGVWKMVAFYASREKGTVWGQDYAKCVPIDIISKY